MLQAAAKEKTHIMFQCYGPDLLPSSRCSERRDQQNIPMVWSRCSYFRVGCFFGLKRSERGEYGQDTPPMVYSSGPNLGWIVLLLSAAAKEGTMRTSIKIPLPWYGCVQCLLASDGMFWLSVIPLPQSIPIVWSGSVPPPSHGLVGLSAISSPWYGRAR